MKITHDLLVRRHACAEGIEFLDKYYPDGVELIDLLTDLSSSKYQLPVDFYYWGETNLGFDDDYEKQKRERAMFERLLAIDRSSAIVGSNRIKDSYMVGHSKYVERSRSVFHSEHVSDSDDVNGSARITKSHGVFDSKFVSDSGEVLFSVNVTNSTNVINSHYIVNSANILDSTNIVDCRDCRTCTNMDNSSFCVDCNDSSNLIFCIGIDNANSHIFNEKVQPSVFQMVAEQYKRIMPTRLRYAAPYVPNSVLPQSIQVDYDHRKYYRDIMESEEIRSWIMSLPHFSANVWYDMTHCRIN